MSFEESWKYDFRIRSLLNLIDRLEEYAAVINLPIQSYTRPERTRTQPQPSLFPNEENIFVVVGKTCAGKTTFGEHALQKSGMRFIEASSIVRTFKDEYPKHFDAFQLAKTVLDEKGPDIVARKITQLYSSDLTSGCVITGFRAIEELETLKNFFPNAKVILIEASEKTRFQRYIQRCRGISAKNMEEFRLLDEKQWAFGLLRVAEDFADVKITNEGKLEEYFGQIESVISGQDLKEIPGISTSLKPKYEVEHDQLYKSLTALKKLGRPLDCGEIEQITRSMGNPVRHNNANKVLKRVPELAKRLETKGLRIRYEITNAGRAYLRFIETTSKKQ